MTYTPAQIIEKYLELRELKKAEKAAFVARETELNNMLEAMENHLLAVMQERGEKNIKTEKGTAFQAPQGGGALGAAARHAAAAALALGRRARRRAGRRPQRAGQDAARRLAPAG